MKELEKKEAILEKHKAEKQVKENALENWNYAFKCACTEIGITTEQGRKFWNILSDKL